MLQAYQVARLPRPHRLRFMGASASPFAFSRLPATARTFSVSAVAANAGGGQTSRYIYKPKPKPKILRPSVKEDVNVPAFGTQRAEWNDYEQAKEMARVRRRRPPTESVQADEETTKLPSLLSRTRAARRKAAESALDTPLAEAGPSGSGSADSAPPKSLKGKEKAEDQTPEPHEAGAASAPSGQDGSTPSGIRRNPVGVQLLSHSLHAQMFPGDPLPAPPDSLLQISKVHLAANGLSPEGAAVLPEISFDMPELQGSNIREHFHLLGQHGAEPYLSMARQYAELELPPIPDQWVLDRPGWTKYSRDGTVEAVQDLGDERIVTFDVETLYKLSKYPVMATAASETAWYAWLSPTLFEDPPVDSPPAPKPWETQRALQHPHELIPLFSNENDALTGTPRIVLGHNVGYDRARIKEEYTLDGTSTRFLDTLALHVSTRGITSVQRPIWMKHKKEKAQLQAQNEANLAALQDQASEAGDSSMAESLATLGESMAGDFEALQKRWEDVTSINSLAEVAALHLGRKVDKSIRDRFGDESITHASQLRPGLADLLTYCAGDTATTHEVYRKVLPLFLDSCPHPASFAGVLTMGSAFLPVNESWKQYLHDAEAKYRALEGNVRNALRILADKTRREGPKEDDPWSAQLDWSPKAARWADEPDLAGQGASAGPGADAAESSGKVDVLPTPDGPIEPIHSAATCTPSPESTESITFESTESSSAASSFSSTPAKSMSPQPAWYADLHNTPDIFATSKWQNNILPLILQISYKTYPVCTLPKQSRQGWCFRVPRADADQYETAHGPPLELEAEDRAARDPHAEYAFFPIARQGESKRMKLTGRNAGKDIASGDLTSPHPALLNDLIKGKPQDYEAEIVQAAQDLLANGRDTPWGAQLNWVTRKIQPAVPGRTTPASKSSRKKAAKASARSPGYGTWPKWYWELSNPAGEFDLTTRKMAAPVLLRLQWQGYPLCYSKEYKWIFRMPKSGVKADEAARGMSRGPPLDFSEAKSGDEAFAADKEHVYFRIPHNGGEGKNVGTVLGKSFVKAIESGELASATAAEGEVDDVAKQAATDATNLNVLCSYWISSRERIMEQFVVYDDPDKPTSGMILPPVISMGTVTRRAVEATWLTASNAKKNRVGSELKAMVRAPPGYALVGADVDSEELWISSVMGDSQFGMHGATAIGWMTLEGTKSAGTDLHSKTANILGISRDGAKVFNYSRIYGAGQKHAVQLLMQGDSTLSKDKAEQLAKDLYKATKGAKQVRSRKLAPAAAPYLWHGGSESYLFNTLEAIALSNRPTTPALGCGVTKALSKSYLEEGTAYLPSRINWVVQSSGVDYLHLLITSMDYLIKKYDIKARYLLSVHDEVRYLCKDEDRYRSALALQIANAWTRALFCYNLGLGDMPQGIAFFSAVDVDHVLRKEVNMLCETPSHPRSIPPGESLDIMEVLEKTGGKLGEPVRANEPLTPLPSMVIPADPPVKIVQDLRDPAHRQYLGVQASTEARPSKRWLDDQQPLAWLDDRSFSEVRAEKRKEKADTKALLRDWEEQSARLSRMREGQGANGQEEWDYPHASRQRRGEEK